MEEDWKHEKMKERGKVGREKKLKAKQVVRDRKKRRKEERKKVEKTGKDNFL